MQQKLEHWRTKWSKHKVRVVLSLASSRGTLCLKLMTLGYAVEVWSVPIGYWLLPTASLGLEWIHTFSIYNSRPFYRARRVRIMLGSTKRTGLAQHESSLIVIHNQYFDYFLTNDIALVKLDTPAVISKIEYKVLEYKVGFFSYFRCKC